MAIQFNISTQEFFNPEMFSSTSKNQQDPEHWFRTIGSEAQVVTFGNCQMHLDRLQILLNLQNQDVTWRVFMLVAYLWSQRPRVVPYQEILNVAWKAPKTSHNAIAKAVMEARRAVGDSHSEPTIIVTVRGIGYRFVEPISYSEELDDETVSRLNPCRNQDPLKAVQGLADSILLLIQSGNLDEAKCQADTALQIAQRAGSNGSQSIALYWQSSLALRRGSVLEAMSLGTQALRMAKKEAVDEIEAQARMAIGAAHLYGGNLNAAIECLVTAREMMLSSHLSDPALLFRCTSLLTLALRNDGKLKDALDLCRKNIEFGHKNRIDHTLMMVDLMNEPLFLAYLADQGNFNPDSSNITDSYESALLKIEELLAVMKLIGPGSMLPACLANKSFILERLNRLEESWETLLESESEAQTLTKAGSTLHADHEQTRLYHRSRLLMRMGKLGDALRSIELAIGVGESSISRHWLPLLYQQGSEIAEASGHLGLALKWSRDQSVAQNAAHRDSSALLTAMFTAEVQTHDLIQKVEDLESTIDRLLRENDALRRNK